MGGKNELVNEKARTNEVLEGFRLLVVSTSSTPQAPLGRRLKVEGKKRQ